MTEKTLKKRQELKELSKQDEDTAKKIAEETNNPLILLLSVNDKIMNFIYNPKNNLEFRSFRNWKEQGYTVKKGSKAFLLWGQPINKNAESKDDLHNVNDADNEDIFFPLAFIFSSDQVLKIKAKEPAEV